MAKHIWKEHKNLLPKSKRKKKDLDNEYCNVSTEESEDEYTSEPETERRFFNTSHIYTDSKFIFFLQYLY